MSTFVFSPKHKGALDRPLVVALVDTRWPPRGRSTTMQFARHSRIQVDRLGCIQDHHQPGTMHAHALHPAGDGPEHSMDTGSSSECTQHSRGGASMCIGSS